MDETLFLKEVFINSPVRFFHYEPLFTSSFSKNLIIPEAVMLSKGQRVTNRLRFKTCCLNFTFFFIDKKQKRCSYDKEE